MIDRILIWLGGQLNPSVFAGGAALGIAGGAIATLHRLLPRLYRLAVGAVTVSIIVDSRSDAFEPLALWLHNHPYAKRCRHLSVSTTGNDDDSSGKPELIFTPAPGSHIFMYQGVPVRLNRSRAPKGEDAPARGGRVPTESMELTSFGRNRGVLGKLIEEAFDRHGLNDPNFTIVHGVADYMEWERLARVRRRPLESVVLRQGIAEHLLADARQFLTGADWHIQRGIPWRRGYLLYGPPGTGKTSLVKAMAGTLNLDIAIVNLSTATLDDRALCKLLATAPARSILLIEDVDSAFHHRAKEDAGGRVTFSGLLNAIDGVMSQEGHLLFITTNHIERLDPALIRPGRIDVRVETGPVDSEMAQRMFLNFFPGETALATRFSAAIEPSGTVAAEIQAHLLSHRDSPVMASRMPGQPVAG